MPSDSKQPWIVAVSGGVDSVVLLHQLVQQHPATAIIVAHVDHGIRAASASDAAFVAQLAAEYGCQFRLCRLHLGSQASEQQAREGRYRFLRQLAQETGGQLYTAHHADDVIETIAINVQRGTGWRGLAVMSAADITRPLTRQFKAELIQYAHQHQLTWREDSTNQTSRYLRNRVRQAAQLLPVTTKRDIIALWHRQQAVAAAIDAECHHLATNQRHFYIMSSPLAAEAVLRQFLAASGVSLTRPQLQRTLLAIKTQHAGAVIDLAQGNRLQIGRRTVHISTNQ